MPLSTDPINGNFTAGEAGNRELCVLQDQKLLLYRPFVLECLVLERLGNSAAQTQLHQILNQPLNAVSRCDFSVSPHWSKESSEPLPRASRGCPPATASSGTEFLLINAHEVGTWAH